MLTGPFQLKKQTVVQSPSGASVVQRVTTQILPGAESGYIGKVAIVGRPENTFSGSMGDHTTAFTAIASGIQMQLEGKTAFEGAKFLYELSDKLHDLPGMKLIGNLKDPHKSMLNHALKNLAKFQADVKNRYLPPDDSSKKSPDALPGTTAHDLSMMEFFANAYLEARELVPLSTIDTRKIGIGNSGKGKGENADALVDFEKGKNINLSLVASSLMSLFDPWSVAAAVSITDQNIADKKAPGLKVSDSTEDKAKSFILQFLDTLEFLYPKTLRALKDKKYYDDIRGKLLGSVKEIVTQSVSTVSNEVYSSPKKEKKYLTSAVSVDDQEVIVGINMDGRPVSPFPGSMGAHTTAWVVHADLIRKTLIGNNIKSAVSIMLDLCRGAIDEIKEWGKVFPVSIDHTYKIKYSLTQFDHIIDLLQSAKNPPTTSVPKKKEETTGWEMAAILQEAITGYLEIQNLTPGAALNSTNTSGHNEGKHREVLLNYNEYSEEQVKEAIQGMLDIRELGDHLETVRDNTQTEETNESEKQQRIDYNKFTKSKHIPNPDVTDAADWLVTKHLKLIETAYPGALKHAKLNQLNFFEKVKGKKKKLKKSEDSDFELEDD